MGKGYRYHVLGYINNFAMVCIMSIPYISRQDNNKVVILGEPENLLSLSEMIKLKVKMGGNYSGTLKDSDGNMIEVLMLSEDGRLV